MATDISDEHTSTTPIDIESPEHLQSVLDEYSLVLLDFHAEWCGPCQMMEPMLEDLAADSVATVARIDVDEQQTLAADHEVRGVPTIEAYHNGEPFERLVGATSEEKLRSVIDSRPAN